MVNTKFSGVRAAWVSELVELWVRDYFAGFRSSRTSVPSYLLTPEFLPQSYEFFLEPPNNNAFIFNEISKYFSIHSLVEKHRKLESWKVDI